MLEKDIERKVTEYAKSLGCLSFKFTSTSCKGVPDRFFINKFGLIIFIEFKRLGAKATPLQLMMINKLLDQNCAVYVIDNVIYGKELLDQFMNCRLFLDSSFEPRFSLPF